MLETLIAAVFSFVGTNIDDLFLNALFFTQASAKKEHRSVVVGKYIGIFILIVLSLLGAYGLALLPEKYLSLLGLLPIALGVRAWFKGPQEETATLGPQTNKELFFALALNVALVTLSNGADNIGVYIPLFTGYSVSQLLVSLLVFFLMTALWCFLGKKLSDLPILQSFLLKHRRILVPLLLILLGIYVLCKGFL